MEANKIIVVTATGNATGDSSKYQDCVNNYNQAIGQMFGWASSENRSFLNATTSQLAIPLGNDNFLFTKTTQFFFEARITDFDANNNPTYQIDYIVQ